MSTTALSKVARARRHLQEWDAITDAYRSSTPYGLEERDDAAAGQRQWVMRVRRDPPPDLSLVAGDVVHNVRAALDHLAYDLVLSGGGTPNRSSFPITDRPTGWAKEAEKALGGATDSARQAVAALQPWKGGDQRLWELHHLDIVDKHRLLLVVLGQTSSVTVGGGTQVHPDVPEPIPVPELHYPLTNPEPVHDGLVVWTRPLNMDQAALQAFLPRPNISVSLAFGPGSDLEGEVVRDVLARVL